jgi:flagellar biosynthesis/type III secretory pathway protein FliH
MSSRSMEVDNLAPAPIKALIYLDMASPTAPANATRSTRGELSANEANYHRAQIELSQDELEDRITLERAAAILQIEQRLREEYELKLEAAAASIATAISSFEAERGEYYRRVETEIIQLTLAIVAKILHRETQVDPMLVATLVRMTIEKMREGSNVIVRVGRGRASDWKEYFSVHSKGVRPEVVEDPALAEHDCLLVTELGIANFGLDAQLKEVEQGFFDLLALRPVKG